MNEKKFTDEERSAVVKFLEILIVGIGAKYPDGRHGLSLQNLKYIRSLLLDDSTLFTERNVDKIRPLIFREVTEMLAFVGAKPLVDRLLDRLVLNAKSGELAEQPACKNLGKDE